MRSLDSILHGDLFRFAPALAPGTWPALQPPQPPRRPATISRRGRPGAELFRQVLKDKTSMNWMNPAPVEGFIMLYMSSLFRTSFMFMKLLLFIRTSYKTILYPGFIPVVCFYMSSWGFCMGLFHTSPFNPLVWNITV